LYVSFGLFILLLLLLLLFVFCCCCSMVIKLKLFRKMFAYWKIYTIQICIFRSDWFIFNRMRMNNRWYDI
jgi:hypothetical protein